MYARAAAGLRDARGGASKGEGGKGSRPGGGGARGRLVEDMREGRRSRDGEMPKGWLAGGSLADAKSEGRLASPGGGGGLLRGCQVALV